MEVRRHAQLLSSTANARRRKQCHRRLDSYDSCQVAGELSYEDHLNMSRSKICTLSINDVRDVWISQGRLFLQYA